MPYHKSTLHKPYRLTHGFTLIELMIVIGTITIIAAIAIPNLMRSRLSANEAVTISTMKAYANAQVTFQVSREGRRGSNTKAGNAGYCDNFRNLHYGNPYKAPSDNLLLISKAFADAFARAPNGNQASTNNSPITAPGTPRNYQGFMFSEPNEMISVPGKFTTDFALLAVPEETGRTGDNAFWMGTQGNVKFIALNSRTGYTANIGIATPSDPATLGTWGSF